MEEIHSFILWKIQSTSSTLDKWHNKWSVLKFSRFISQDSQIHHCFALEVGISTWNPYQERGQHSLGTGAELMDMCA